MRKFLLFTAAAVMSFSCSKVETEDTSSLSDARIENPVVKTTAITTEGGTENVSVIADPNSTPATRSAVAQTIRIEKDFVDLTNGTAQYWDLQYKSSVVLDYPILIQQKVWTVDNLQGIGINNIAFYRTFYVPFYAGTKNSEVVNMVLNNWYSGELSCHVGFALGTINDMTPYSVIKLDPNDPNEYIAVDTVSSPN